LSPDGNFTSLHSFEGGEDGGNPSAALLRDHMGNFFGTTARGGTKGYGTVFRIDTAGHEGVLHSFLGGHDDGVDPAGPLIIDKDGNLFGTTNSGGSAGAGIIFELAAGKADGTMTEMVLHSFAGKQDGAHPNSGGLAWDNAGSFYGTTAGGGAAGKGTIFKMSLHGIETIVHSFTGADGALPVGGLMFDGYGSFYGTTFESGTVFKLAPRGTVSTVYRWQRAFPHATLIADPAASLIGTTSTGGASDGGTVFSVTPGRNGDAKYATLYSFEPGSQPVAGLIIGQDGKYYGTTLTGGAMHKGTLYVMVR
jgi:uncharacterized repeat protein (TIGR03803 family)